MAGSIRQLASGNWQLRAPAGTDPITGKRRVITETVTGSRRSAEQRLAELVSRGRRGAAPAATTSTVADVLAAWLDLPRLARSTRAKATTALKHVPPAVLRQRADRLTGRELDQLYRHLEQAGVGAPTIRTIHGTISAAFGQAVKWGTVDRNPAALATQPRAGRSRADGDVTDTQIAALVAAVEHDPQHALWLRLHLTTAARRSEILAIRWSAVLPDDRLVLRAALERDGVEKDTKTHQTRTIAIDPTTSAMIRGWQTVQRRRSLATGVSLDPDPFLLSHEPDSSQPWKPASSTQLFIRLRRRAGIGDGVRLHDLRHAAASYLIAAGVDIPTVSARLGHSNPRTTLTVYAHVLEGRDTQAADALARRLLGR